MSDAVVSTVGQLQMALIFRADLPQMLRGKSEIQAAHAAFEIACKLSVTDKDLIDEYLAQEQPKVNVEVDSEDALFRIAKKAAVRGVPYQVITDAGRTVFEEPTVTCMIAGPMTKTDSNALTRGTRMRDRQKQSGDNDQLTSGCAQDNAAPSTITGVRRKVDDVVST
jgi:PTH2 family peptidyl-tRNA hydrolase